MPDGELHLDSYMSILGGFVRPHSFGTLGTDLQTQFGLGSVVYTSLAQTYCSSGLAARIVDMPADDAVARGFCLEDEKEEADKDLKTELARLKVGPACADAVRWSRLYGASLILIIARDGGELKEPLNEATLEEIESLIVYEAPDISVNSYYEDDTQKNFGEPETYRISAG